MAVNPKIDNQYATKTNVLYNWTANVANVVKALAVVE